MKSITKALVRTGVPISTSTLVTSTVHTRIGMRKRVMPGARMRKTVTMKLTAPRIELVPTRMTATIHRFIPGPGLYLRLLTGGYAVQPASAAPPSKNPEAATSPEKGTIQKLRALMRGKAMSGAPIMSGTT